MERSSTKKDESHLTILEHISKIRRLISCWFYESHPETGADFAGPRRALSERGIRTTLIPTIENGDVHQNAKIIADAVHTATRVGDQILLASASKAGAETALALGRYLSPSVRDEVLAWLSIGGVIRGTPFADTMLRPELCWIAALNFAFEGADVAGLESLSTSRQRRDFQGLDFGRTLRVSYIPVPLSGQITERAALGYRALRDDGPNDGLTLLIDELLPGGIAIIEPGLDHFLNESTQIETTMTLFDTLLLELKDRR